jgi:hypothetical protein
MSLKSSDTANKFFITLAMEMAASQTVCFYSKQYQPNIPSPTSTSDTALVSFL